MTATREEINKPTTYQTLSSVVSNFKGSFNQLNMNTL